MKQTVFISYSSKDRQFAQKIAETLEQQGFDVWIDRDDIRAGVKWSSAIQAGLDQASIIVVIITPDAMTSKNVEDEWQYYLDKNKPIVPILHHPTENIHFQLMRIQYVDFVNFPYEDAVKRLIYELGQHGVDGAGSEALPTSHEQQRVAIRPKTNRTRNIAISVVLVLAGVTMSEH